MDCCPDYAETCLEPSAALATCAGAPDACAAAATAPQPLPGGGYCFCDDHCRLWFTDNNSGGSCCPDWRQVCEGVKEGTTCLDARAQGSALGLFVAAAVVP